MELDELEVGECRTRPVGEGEALAECTARVRRPLPESGVAAGRDHDAASRARARAGDDAGTPSVGPQKLEHAVALGDLDPGVLANAGGEHLGDPAAGLGPAGVHDPAARVTALAREAVVELNAERAQVGDSRRRLGCEELHGARPAEPPPGGERVGRVQGRVVVGADGRGDATLGRVAVRRAERALREHEHRRFLGGAERGGQSGDPGSDHDDVVARL